MTRDGLLILATAFALASCERGAAEGRRSPSAPAPIGSPEAARDANAPREPEGAAGEGARLPLARALAIVGAEIPGEVIEVELDADDDQEAYEITVLTAQDRRVEVTLDARTGRIIEREED